MRVLNNYFLTVWDAMKVTLTLLCLKIENSKGKHSSTNCELQSSGHKWRKSCKSWSVIASKRISCALASVCIQQCKVHETPNHLIKH